MAKSDDNYQKPPLKNVWDYFRFFPGKSWEIFECKYSELSNKRGGTNKCGVGIFFFSFMKVKIRGVGAVFFLCEIGGKKFSKRIGLCCTLIRELRVSQW